MVDTAPTFDDITLTALDETDECIILATLDVPTLKNVKVALETLELLDISRGHRHLLLNRADDVVGISMDKVESILGMPIAVQIGSAVEIAAATNAGTPILADNPHHPSSVAIASSPGSSPASRWHCVAAPPTKGTAHGSRPRAGASAEEQVTRMSTLSDRLAAARLARGHAASTQHRSRRLRRRPPARPGGGRRRGAPLRAGGPAGGVHHYGSRRVSPAPRRAAYPRQPAEQTGSTSSRPACTPSCSRSSVRTSTTPRWTRPTSTSRSAPSWPTCSAARTGRSATPTAPGHPGDQRRHPGLRPDRAVPARPRCLRGHGQRSRQHSGWRTGQFCTPTPSSSTRPTCAAPSTRSCRASAAASTRPARWSTPACPTAAGSTRWFRRWRWTAPR